MSNTSMELARPQFVILTVLGVLALGLVLSSIGLTLNNRDAQAQVTARQQFIDQTDQLRILNKEIIEALANLSVHTGDESRRELLATQGITIQTQPEVAE